MLAETLCVIIHLDRLHPFRFANMVENNWAVFTDQFLPSTNGDDILWRKDILLGSQNSQNSQNIYILL